MPQFDFTQAVPQILWLVLVFGAVYLLVSRTIPRVGRVVQDRKARIAADLSAAETARADAELAAAGGTAEVGEARGSAQKLTGEARRQADAEIAARIRTAEAAIAERLATSEQALERARGEALADLDQVAVEAAGELVERVAGLHIPADKAAAAVRKVAA